MPSGVLTTTPSNSESFNVSNSWRKSLNLRASSWFIFARSTAFSFTSQTATMFSLISAFMLFMPMPPMGLRAPTLARIRLLGTSNRK